MARLFPQIICGFFGIVLFVLYFLKAPAAKSLYLTITSDYWQIIFAFALIVGVVSFIRVNIKKATNLSESLYVITGLIGLFAMPAMALDQKYFSTNLPNITLVLLEYETRVPIHLSIIIEERIDA